MPLKRKKKSSEMLGRAQHRRGWSLAFYRGRRGRPHTAEGRAPQETVQGRGPFSPGLLTRTAEEVGGRHRRAREGVGLTVLAEEAL